MKSLPRDGIDLRAELEALKCARVRQALERTGGDLAAAARLLRMSRVDLLRLEARIEANGAPEASAGRRRKATESEPIDVARIAGGVEFVSARAIVRLARDGMPEKQIARRMGCNPYLVERVLRRQRESAARALDADGLSVREIAARLRQPASRIARILDPSLDESEAP
jgi:DNA-directed RNA polymerase specialized sigma24 family protein